MTVVAEKCLKTKVNYIVKMSRTKNKRRIKNKFNNPQEENNYVINVMEQQGTRHVNKKVGYRLIDFALNVKF